MTLADYAQLVTSSVVAPTLTIGDPAQIVVSWTVINEGTGYRAHHRVDRQPGGIERRHRRQWR